ncbi:MAG: efflux RND transporter permease subunit, partial [Actinomycetota bacterium]|nr:efflux RND transporter permease subunit [Actinomycetota bacterium]
MATPVRKSIISRLATAAARRWKVTILVWAGLLALGGYAYFVGLDREGFPPIDVPVVVIDGAYFVDDASAVDNQVATPLYQAYREVEGVKEIQSFSRPSSYAVVVEFDSDVASPEGAALLDAVTPDLGVPASVNIRPLQAAKFIERYDVVVTVNAPGGATAAELEA